MQRRAGTPQMFLVLEACPYTRTRGVHCPSQQDHHSKPGGCNCCLPRAMWLCRVGRLSRSCGERGASEREGRGRRERPTSGHRTGPDVTDTTDTDTQHTARDEHLKTQLKSHGSRARAAAQSVREGQLKLRSSEELTRCPCTGTGSPTQVWRCRLVCCPRPAPSSDAVCF